MSATTEQPAPAASRHALPDPGEGVPAISWPIVGIFSGAIAVFAFSTWAALADRLPAPATVLLSATAIFVLFTVLHDAAHYSISTHRWVNVAFGRVAMLFVSPLISFKSFAFIHIEHHRNTNDDDERPRPLRQRRSVVAASRSVPADGRAVPGLPGAQREAPSAGRGAGDRRS